MKEYEINVSARGTVYIESEDYDEAVDEVESMSPDEIFDSINIDSVNEYNIEEE